MNNQRINIFTGHFGSGKTEIAVNYAIRLKKHYHKVAIVDLDIVNPYFRTKDARQLLERKGIKVVASAFAGTNIDLPSLPPEIFSMFHNKEYQIVFDVGGDDRGAIALSRYRQYFSDESYHMFFVINCKRPMTKDAASTLEILREVEQRSRLKVSSLINNTNLSHCTNVDDLLIGQSQIEEVSKEMAVPISFITGGSEVLGQLPEHLKPKAFPIELYLRFPWEEST